MDVWCVRATRKSVVWANSCLMQRMTGDETREAQKAGTMDFGDVTTTLTLDHRHSMTFSSF